MRYSGLDEPMSHGRSNLIDADETPAERQFRPITPRAPFSGLPRRRRFVVAYFAVTEMSFMGPRRPLGNSFDLAL